MIITSALIQIASIFPTEHALKETFHIPVLKQQTDVPMNADAKNADLYKGIAFAHKQERYRRIYGNKQEHFLHLSP